MSEPFWTYKRLEEMDQAEWESLCDGCAKCCLQKLEDEDDGEVYYTQVACRYLDHDSCQCTVYPRRHQLVPGCLWLKAEHVREFHWLPSTCAYRLVAEGKPLPEWHPLVSGSPESVHRAGVSLRGRALNEDHVHPDEWEEHIVRWVE